MGAAAFWIALAAVIIAGNWFKSRKEQMRHETVRLLIEKGEELDPEQLRELLNPAPPSLPIDHAWFKPGPSGYKQFRMIGTILMIAAPGLVALVAGIGYPEEPDVLTDALAIGVFVFVIGAAFFFVSRFVAPTDSPEREEDRARGGSGVG